MTKLEDHTLEELKQLNDYARSIFSQFVAWWAFFIAQNLVAAVFLSNADKRPETYIQLAWVVTVLNFVGALFCLIVSIRLVQINDRVIELATQRDPSTSPLGNPARIGKMFTETLRQTWVQPKRTLGNYNSPDPLGFYLLCTVPTMLACFAVTAVWVFCIGAEGWW